MSGNHSGDDMTASKASAEKSITGNTALNPQTVKLQSTESWQTVRDEFYATGNAALVQSKLTSLVDHLAIQAFHAALAPMFPKGLTMLAVGGYGRRELFPFSDIDIMLLADSEVQTAALTGAHKEALSEFVRNLWDAGLRLSHSVRTVADCLEVHEQNVELNISLIDRRFLAGDQDVKAKLEGRMPGFLSKNGAKLAKHLCRLTRTRHEKYQDTLFHLEPDIKETPGGLRDLHFINWLGSLRPELRPESAYTNSAGMKPLDDATAFLSSLRCFLHYDAGRDRNLLNFEAQEQIIAQPFTAEKVPPAWMREYFIRARAVFREAQRTLDATEKSDSSLLTSFRDLRGRLSNSEFTVSKDRVLLRNSAQLSSDPEMILRLLEFVARHGVLLAADSERRLEAARPAFAGWCAVPRPLWKALKIILSLPHAVMALRVLQNTGLMQVLIPDWEKVVSLVVRDFYHRYTVDEHTLVCLEQLDALRHTQEPIEGRFAGLLSEIDNSAVLLFALLFHDVGKGAFSGKHSQVGHDWVRTCMQRMQAPENEIDSVAFLVLHHLALSEVMTGRDLADPATARALAERVGTIERLRMLAVLTYADISGVNPGAMTPWRLEQLWRVYRVAQQELTRELETERIQEIPKEIAGQSDFLKGLPVRYLRTHSPAEISKQLALYAESRPTGVGVRLDKAEGVYQVTVIARDMPALFASLAGALSSFGLDILKAEAFSNSKGLILDTFVFADPRRNLELNPSETERLKDLLRKVAAGKTDVSKMLRDRPPAGAKRPQVAPNVTFDSQACESATLVEITTADRPGLLYNLSTVFSAAACNIDVVLIDTKGHRAIDVFYVAQNGAKLADSVQQMLKERLIAAC